MEAESLAGCFIQRLPVATGGFKQRVGSDHVGLDEHAGAVDGTVNMAFSSQMHDSVGTEVLEQLCKGRAIGNVDLSELIAI